MDDVFSLVVGFTFTKKRCIYMFSFYVVEINIISLILGLILLQVNCNHSTVLNLLVVILFEMRIYFCSKGKFRFFVIDVRKYLVR